MTNRSSGLDRSTAPSHFFSGESWWQPLQDILQQQQKQQGASHISPERDAQVWQAAVAWAQQHFAAHPLLFRVAWAAHASATMNHSAAAQLGCIAVLYYCCLRTTAPRLSSVSPPFFPLLVEDVFSILHRYETGDVVIDKESCLTVRSALLYVVEEHILPVLLEDNPHISAAQILRDTNDENQQQYAWKPVLLEAIEKWTSVHHDPAYVSPLLHWANEPHRATLAKKEQDLRKLALLSSSSVAKIDDVVLPEVVPTEELLEPQSSIRVPFGRPPPPPLLPFGGHEDDDNEALTEQEKSHYHDHLQAELIWLTPNSNLRLMMIPDDDDDGNQGHNDDKEQIEAARKLLQSEAFSRPLAPNEQRLVLEHLQVLTDDDSAGAIRPQTLSKLVEHNPMVAHEFLSSVLQGKSKDADDYLAILVSMDLTLHTMEVVNRLATAKLLHVEYLQLFLGSCMAACSASILDRHAQNRMVRLVCIFIQSLLRSGTIHRDDLHFLQVQAFCVEFSRIREAATLYKTLQQEKGGKR